MPTVFALLELVHIGLDVHIPLIEGTEGLESPLALGNFDITGILPSRTQPGGLGNVFGYLPIAALGLDLPYIHDVALSGYRPPYPGHYFLRDIDYT